MQYIIYIHLLWGWVFNLIHLCSILLAMYYWLYNVESGCPDVELWTEFVLHHYENYWDHYASCLQSPHSATIYTDQLAVVSRIIFKPAAVSFRCVWVGSYQLPSSGGETSYSNIHNKSEIITIPVSEHIITSHNNVVDMSHKILKTKQVLILLKGIWNDYLLPPPILNLQCQLKLCMHSQKIFYVSSFGCFWNPSWWVLRQSSSRNGAHD